MGYQIVFLLKFILFFPYRLLIKGENHLHEKWMYKQTHEQTNKQPNEAKKK